MNIEFNLVNKRCYLTYFEVKLELTTSMKQYTKSFLQEIVYTRNFNSCQLNGFPMASKFAKGSDKTLWQRNEGNRL